MRPSDSQLRDWANVLGRPCRDQPNDTTWAALIEELVVFRARDVEIDEPDGYPTGGDGGSGELTPTEAAAQARMRAHADAYHQSVEVATDFLLQAVQSANAVMNRLRLLRELTKDRPAEARFCEICRPTVHHPPVERTTFGGVTPTAVEVCGPARDLIDRRIVKWRKTNGTTPTLEDVKPTAGEIRGHADTGYWREHVNPKQPA